MRTMAWLMLASVAVAAAATTALPAAAEAGTAVAAAGDVGRDRGEKAGYADAQAGDASDPQPGAFSAVAGRETTTEEETAYRAAYDAAYREAYKRGRDECGPIFLFGNGGG
jgi:uncharacterized membrane protein